jgi:uncharacterized membrane protein YjdF
MILFKKPKNESFIIHILLWTLRLVILGTVVWTLFQFQWESFFLAVLAYVLSFIPEFIELQFKTFLPVEFDFAVTLFVFLSVFLGEIGGVYERFFWWDAVLHLAFGFTLGYVAFLWLYVKVKQGKLDAGPKMKGFIIFCVALALGALWEIFEFFMDQIFGLNMQKSGLVDTMWDLIIDAVGAGAMAIIGVLYMKKGGIGPIRTITHRFMSQNKLWR